MYTFYLRIFRRQIYAQYQKEFTFYKNVIGNTKDPVFDIGANVGDKSQIFSQISNSVVAVEPDRANAEILRRRFRLRNKVRIIQAAVGSKQGIEQFHVTSAGSPANTLSSKWVDILENPEKNRWAKALTFTDVYNVDVITIDSLVERFGLPFYIKIDVEGYEFEALRGLNKTTPIISLEANFPEFRQETLRCISHLHGLSNTVRFNIVDGNFRFFWEKNEGYDFTVDWINKTELKYFEIFCFSD